MEQNPDSTASAGNTEEMHPDLKLLGIVPHEWSEWMEPYLAVICSMLKAAADNMIKFKNSAKEQIKGLSNFEIEDWWTLEGLTYLTLITVIFMSILVISVNIYKKIRYAIPATVNCWFCNTNSKVLYSLRDTWTCPKCHQYNGFTSDGGYNKRIPAQFIEALNRPIRGGPANGYQFKKGGPNTNGLCSQCNLNQVLKVFQLSSFVPVNERNYGAEIEAEQKRLEQLYDICHQCKLVVEETLERTPDKIRNKPKVNKVAPTNMPVQTPENLFGKGPSMTNHDYSYCRSDYQNSQDISSGSENDSGGSGDSFLSLDNLNIGPKSRLANDSFEGFHVPNRATSSPKLISPMLSRSPGSSPSLYTRNNKTTGGASPVFNNKPLWKDYPMVQSGSSSQSRTYSMIDAMSCPPGRPAYICCSPPPGSPGAFSYQSSNLGSVFGGQRPIISPQKFSNVNAHTFASHIRYGPYYDVTSSPNHFFNTPAPMAFNPHYFTNPISRSSSQSSGFVSQQGGGGVVTSQAQPSISTGFYIPSS